MQISESHPELRSIPWDEFREIVRNQFFLVVFDEEVAAETLPDLVPTMEERRLAVDIVEKAGQAVRPPSAEEQAELDGIRRMLGVTVTAVPEAAPVKSAPVTPLHKETPPAEEPQAAGRSAHAARAARPAARSGAAKATTRTRKPKAGTASRSKA